jgi:hypothetical protein
MSDQTRWAAGYVIHFKDGGEPEEQVLHIGTREECERTAELVSAVSYSGDRPIDCCRFVICPVPTPEAP